MQEPVHYLVLTHSLVTNKKQVLTQHVVPQHVLHYTQMLEKGAEQKIITHYNKCLCNADVKKSMDSYLCSKKK